MSRCLALLLYWSPRVLGVAFVLFLSLFALDAFHDVHGFGLSSAHFSSTSFPQRQSPPCS